MVLPEKSIKSTLNKPANLVLYRASQDDSWHISCLKKACGINFSSQCCLFRILVPLSQEKQTELQRSRVLFLDGEPFLRSEIEVGTLRPECQSTL